MTEKLETEMLEIAAKINNILAPYGLSLQCVNSGCGGYHLAIEQAGMRKAAEVEEREAYAAMNELSQPMTTSPTHRLTMRAETYPALKVAIWEHERVKRRYERHMRKHAGRLRHCVPETAEQAALRKAAEMAFHVSSYAFQTMLKRLQQNLRALELAEAEAQKTLFLARVTFPE